MYWSYFKFIMEHKKNVFIECIKMRMFVHAFTHDLSKLRVSEFFPYVRFLDKKDKVNCYKTSDENDVDFQLGWNHHQKRNKHHWHYWVSVTRKDEITSIPMPEKYVKQMVADWRGMSRKFGGSAEEYFLNNKDKMILHPDTLCLIEKYCFNKSYRNKESLFEDKGGIGVVC